MKLIYILLIALPLSTSDIAKVQTFNYVNYEAKKAANKIISNYEIPYIVAFRASKVAVLEELKNGINYKVILAISLRESRLDTSAISKTGVKGVCQMTRARCNYLELCYDSITYLHYGIKAISKSIIKSKAKTAPKQVAMYGSLRRKKLPDSVIIQQWYYVEFLRHFKILH